MAVTLLRYLKASSGIDDMLLPSMWIVFRLVGGFVVAKREAIPPEGMVQSEMLVIESQRERT